MSAATIAIPEALADDVLGALPAGVSAIVWNGDGPPPAELGDIRFMVVRGVLPRHVLARMTGLEVLQILTAGHDPWLGLVPAGVRLCNARGVHGSSTAEMALAGMLALLRRIPEAVKDQADHRWNQTVTDCLDLKRVTVIGAGDVGARIAHGVEVFGARPTLVARRAREGVRAVDELASILPDSDIVALAVPATADTIGLVDRDFLGRMPVGSMLVNVGRGSLVNTDALLAELVSGRLSANLDVTDPELLPPGHPLWAAPNLLITSHVGGGAARWAQRAAHLVIDQVNSWHAGGVLRNVVTDSALRS